jgi:8-oxo-dGTP diphosphatase
LTSKDKYTKIAKRKHSDNERMTNSVYTTFGNKLRVRVCGLCVDNEHLLMINHKGIKTGDFWSPPGGGLQFGETVEACLKREFLEETGLDIEVREFQLICEFIQPPLHAIEMFFWVQINKGVLKTGIDPEMMDKQIIQEAKFMPWTEITRLSPESRHGIFNLVAESSKIVDLKGHFKL